MSDKETRALRERLERLLPEGSDLRRLAEPRPAGPRADDDTTEAVAPPGGEAEAYRAELVRKLIEGESLTSAQTVHIESILIPDTRPLDYIIDGDYRNSLPDIWPQLERPDVRARLKAAIPAVGAIQWTDETEKIHGGTGFLVGPDLIMTNRHVAEGFVRSDGVGGGVLTASKAAYIDFLKERDGGSNIVAFTSVEVLHRDWDLALLRLERAPGVDPIVLSTEPADAAGDTAIALIGYPSFDERDDKAAQDKATGGKYDIKRLKPGKLGPIRPNDPNGAARESLAHDASTLGGSSGSPVISLATGQAVGLHFHGRHDSYNWSIPAYRIVQDARYLAALA